MQRKQPLIIAHRGSHFNREEENTLAAFRRAIDWSVDGLEVDVQLHNQDLILQHDLTEKVDSNRPTFTMFLALVKETGYQGLLLIELKGSQGAALLYEQLMAAQITNPLILQSFWPQPLKIWHQLDGQLSLVYLRHWPNVTAWQLRCADIIQYLNLDYRFWFLGWLRPWGTKVFWWTPNHPELIKLLRRLPIAAIITDVVSVHQKRKG